MLSLLMVSIMTYQKLVRRKSIITLRDDSPDDVRTNAKDFVVPNE